MREIKYENTDKGLCVICDRKINNPKQLQCTSCHQICQPIYEKPAEIEDGMILDVKSDCCNADVEFIGNITCSRDCHEIFIELNEEKFGTFRKIVDENGIEHMVPTRYLIEYGLKLKDLSEYPICEKGE